MNRIGTIATAASVPMTSRTNSQSPRLRLRARLCVALEQRQVPDVRLPAEIEEIAEERNRADGEIDDRIDQHPKLDDARDAQAHARAAAGARRKTAS